MSKGCGLCWSSMTTTIFGYCLSSQHPLGALLVVMLQAARVGSAGMWLLQGCVTGPQVLATVPDTPEWLALSPQPGQWPWSMVSPTKRTVPLWRGTVAVWGRGKGCRVKHSRAARGRPC